jgi:hypothetical protein
MLLMQTGPQGLNAEAGFGGHSGFRDLQNANTVPAMAA